MTEDAGSQIPPQTGNLIPQGIRWPSMLVPTSFDATPEEDPATHVLIPVTELTALRAKADAADRVQELADTYAFLGATLHDVPRAETWTEVATEIHHALNEGQP